MTDREVEVLTHLLEFLRGQERDPYTRTILSRPAVNALAKSVPKAPSKDDEAGWREYEKLLASCVQEDVSLMAEDEIAMLLSNEDDLRQDFAREQELEQQWDRYLASGGAEIEAESYSSMVSHEREAEARDRYRSEWYRYTRQEDADLEEE